jgi:hypothetical protein
MKQWTGKKKSQVDENIDIYYHMYKSGIKKKKKKKKKPKKKHIIYS